MGRWLEQSSWISSLPAWLALAWSLWTLLSINRFYMRTPTCLNPWDEAYITAFAGRMVDGQMLPYVDAVSQRGPVLYWLAAIAVGLGDRTSWMPMRVCATACILLTVALTFLAAHRAGRATAGGVAALAAVAGLLVLMLPADGLAFNGEHALNVFAMASLLCATAALDRRRGRPSARLVAAAGAAGALAALCKQVGLVTIAPIGLWVIAAAASRPDLTRRQRWALPLAFAAGALAPVLAVVARYAAAGELGTFWYWLYTYNADVYMHPFPWASRVVAWRRFVGEHLAVAVTATAAIVWGASRPLLGARGVRDLARAYDEQGFVATVALGAAAALVAALAPMRFFFHYFVQVVPWLGLLAGLLLEHASEGRGRRQLLDRAAMLGSIGLVIAFAWHQQGKDLRRDAGRPNVLRDGNPPRVCAEIQAHSRPGDRLFVWGFHPELYVACKRDAASRYVFTSMVAGFVPFIPQDPRVEESLVVPGSREALIADLDRSQPPVLVDAPTTLGGRSMMRSALLARYVRERYCRWRTIDDLSLFVRREPGAPCPDVPGELGSPGRPPPQRMTMPPSEPIRGADAPVEPATPSR